MISFNHIGEFSLNISFVLYLIIYLPQVWHNRNTKNISHLSFNMHMMLYIGYGLDLLYGFSKDLQWQYKTVSIVSLILITIQHLQITKLLLKNKRSFKGYANIVLLILFGAFIFYFFNEQKHHLGAGTILFIGYISRLCFLLNTLPQIFKNKITQSAKAISLHYVYLSLALSFLDLISAWCLDWGWPNKLGSPFSMMLMLILLTQIKKCKPVPFSTES